MRLAASSCTSRFCLNAGDLVGFKPNKQYDTHTDVFTFSSTTTAKASFVLLELESGPCTVQLNAFVVYEPRSVGFVANSSEPTARARQDSMHMQSRVGNRRTCSRARSTPLPPHLTTRRVQAGAAACWMPRCSSFSIWRGIASASWPAWRRQALTILVAHTMCDADASRLSHTRRGSARLL